MSLQLSVGEATATGPRAENQDALRIVTPTPALAASKGKRAMTPLVGRILRLPQVRKQLEAMGVTVAASTSADFQKLIEAEVTKYARIAKSANITPQ